MRSFGIVLACVLVACGGTEAAGDGEDATMSDTSFDAGDESSFDAPIDSAHETDVATTETATFDAFVDDSTPPARDCAPLPDTTPTCEAGSTICSGTCVDLAHDPTNCGGCGNTCVTHVCCSGVCGGECPAGDVFCGDPCVCVNLATDPNNCGLCGKKCCAGEVCSAGTCVVPCGAGMTACKDPTTGCGFCTNTATDPRNCGGCGIACPPGLPCTFGACD